MVRTASQEGAKPAAAQALVETAFTYQGSLLENDVPLNGVCDFTFALWDALSGGSQIGSTIAIYGVNVVDGLFTVSLDFGPDAFKGDARWLEIQVDCGSGGVLLSPRQPLRAAPYAMSLRPGATIQGSADHGLRLLNSGNTGLYIDGTGTHGVFVYKAGSPSVMISTLGAANGFEVAGAETYGLFVGRADNTGIWVDEAGETGMAISYAGDDGVWVGQAGSPSSRKGDALFNGFEVEGAAGNGLWVGRADSNGVIIDSAGQVGVYVSSSGNDGFDSFNSGYDGVYISYPAEMGVRIYGAGTDGVYADTSQTNQQWGVYTPDKIYAGGGVSTAAMTLVAQNGDARPLDVGEVVVVSGMGAGFGESSTPTPLVQRASTAAETPVFGVVAGRFALTEEVKEFKRNGQTERVVTPHAESADGPAQPGEFVLVTVLGPAQVRADALASDLLPGRLLAAGPDGLLVPAGTETRFGRILGAAMETVDADGDGLVWVLVNPR